MATIQQPLHPEHLIGLGFRYSMACLRPDSGDCGPHACRLLTTAISAQGFPANLRNQFTARALAITSTARRPIRLHALDDPDLTPDERLAVALVAAAQHAHCPALTACASALVGSSGPGHHLGRVLAATQIIAHTLSAAGTVIDPVSIATRNPRPNTRQFPPRLH